MNDDENRPDRDDSERPGKPADQNGPGGNPLGDHPFAGLFGQLNPQDIGMVMQQIGQLLSSAQSSSGPVNWELAQNLARTALASAGPDPAPDSADRTQVAEAIRLADLWLDPVTSFPAGVVSTAAWSRAEWVEATLPVWRQLVEPVAAQVSATMSDALPEEMRALAGPLMDVMRGLGGSMFGAQFGQALAGLAGEVVSATEIGLPLGPAGRAALLPANVTAFGSGLGVPDDQIRLFLALREAAHHRLFSQVPWLRAHLFGAVEAYASGITVDRGRLEQLIGQVDMENPEAVTNAFSSGFFEPQHTPEQQAALARLETALALVEGWVDTVVAAAAGDRLPSAAALRETVRRRRASGGPAEHTFTTLVGLQLRPRRLREAAALWGQLTADRGAAGRDGLWDHPDLLPTADDLANPAGFGQRDSFDLSLLEGLADSADEVPREPRAEDRGGDQDGSGRD